MVHLRCLMVALVAVVLLATVSTRASAFCDTLRYSAVGASEREALARANEKGLVEVRSLDRRFAGRVRYEKAQWTCKWGQTLRCTITQRYCVSEGRPNVRPRLRDNCPGDSALNARGQCVKENEPDRQNPCSGGRLLSQSLRVCHCPEDRPVWTGKNCISAQPTGGVSNREIIERCRVLNVECKLGLRGACRALPRYCDRG